MSLTHWSSSSFSVYLCWLPNRDRKNSHMISINTWKGFASLQQAKYACFICLELQSPYSLETVIIVQVIFLFILFKFVSESSFTYSSGSIFCCRFNSLFHKFISWGSCCFFNFFFSFCLLLVIFECFHFLALWNSVSA